MGRHYERTKVRSQGVRSAAEGKGASDKHVKTITVHGVRTAPAAAKEISQNQL